MLLIFGANGGVGKALLEEARPDYGFLSEDQTRGSRGVYRTEAELESDDSVAAFFAGLDLSDPPLHVINATGHLTNGMIHKAEMAEVEKTVAVNLLGSYRLARHFRTVAPQGSSLTLLSSVVGRLGVPGAASYGMCKAGIHGLVRSAAKEYARAGLRINAIEMGYFDVGMIDRIPEPQQAQIRESIPLQRFGRVGELWGLCRTLIENEYMTGQVVGITGGL